MCNYIWRMILQANVVHNFLKRETIVIQAFSTVLLDSNSEPNITLVKEICTGEVVGVDNIFIT